MSRIRTRTKALELYTGQEIQALQKTVEKRFEMVEKIIRTDEQEEKVQGQDLASPVPVRDNLSRVLTC